MSWRLTVLGAAVMTAMLAVTAPALVILQRDHLIRGIDEELRQRVENYQGDIASRGAATPLLGSDDTEDTFLQLLDASGRVLAASPNLHGTPPCSDQCREGGLGPSAPRASRPSAPVSSGFSPKGSRGGRGG